MRKTAAKCVQALATAMVAATLLSSCADAPTMRQQQSRTPAYGRPEVFAPVDGIEGRVVAHLYVEPSGRVREVKIIESTHERLSQEVIAKGMNWRFKPEERAFIGEFTAVFKRQ